MLTLKLIFNFVDCVLNDNMPSINMFNTNKENKPCNALISSVKCAIHLVQETTPLYIRKFNNIVTRFQNSEICMENFLESLEPIVRGSSDLSDQERIQHFRKLVNDVSHWIECTESV